MIFAAASNAPVIEIALIVGLAIAGVWLAQAWRIPSIVLLLAFGLLAGPVLGWLDPDALLGDLVLPLVSVAVGIILFEGGLSLRIRHLRDHPRVVWLLVSAGVVITWMVGGLATAVFLDIPVTVAVLLGAILVVSGPTVVAPLLRGVRPTLTLRSILTWESIVIDPVGAMLAVVTFEAIRVGLEDAAGVVVADVARFVGAGFIVGLVVAVPMALGLRRRLVPDHLVPGVGIAAAVVAFAAANQLAPEAGLLATTVLGIAVANDPRTPSEEVSALPEALQPLLVGILFIVLTARLTADDLTSIPVGIVAVVASLVLIARPLAVATSTLGSDLDRRARAFLMVVAPRGIVAAAVASLFALELEEIGVEGADILVPATFAVIAATVVLYGLGARPMAHVLGVSEHPGEGLLVFGGGRAARMIAEAGSGLGLRVVLITDDRGQERDARMAGFETAYRNLSREGVLDDIDLSGLGHTFIATDSDAANSLLVKEFAPVFESRNTYRLASSPNGPGLEAEDTGGGQVLIGKEFDASTLAELGALHGVRTTAVTDQVALCDVVSEDESPVVMFALVDGKLVVAVDAAPLAPTSLRPGATAVWIPVASESITPSSARVVPRSGECVEE